MIQVGVGQGKCAQVVRSTKQHKKLRAAWLEKCLSPHGANGGLVVFPKRVAVAFCSRLDERREATALLAIALPLLNRLNLLYYLYPA